MLFDILFLKSHFIRMANYNVPWVIIGSWSTGAPSDIYGYYNVMYITMRVHHHGFFIGRFERKYERERVTYMELFYIHKLNPQTLQGIAHELEIKTMVNRCSLICGQTLDYGLIPLHTESNIQIFKRRIFHEYWNNIVYMFIDRNHQVIIFSCQIHLRGLVLKQMKIFFMNLSSPIRIQLLKKPLTTFGNNRLLEFIYLTCY